MEGGTVLFVSSADGCQPYIDALSKLGVTVLHAVSPEAALHVLSSNMPNIVVTDLAFAETAMKSTEFIREVRARVDDATSIVVLSQYTRGADRDDARAASADLFLMKPAPPSALVFEVHRALILRRGGRRLTWNWPRRTAMTPYPAVERRHGSSRV